MDPATLASLLDPRAEESRAAAEALSAGAGAAAAGEPQQGGAGSDPDVTMVQVFQNQLGPLPLSAPLTTHGGTLAIFVSGSGAVAGYEPGYVYPLGVTVSIDGAYVGQAVVVVTDDAPKTFSNLLVAGAVDYGQHTIEIDNFKGNLSMQGYPVFSLTVLEL